MIKVLFNFFAFCVFVGLSAYADAYYIVGDVNNYNPPTNMSETEREKYALTDDYGDGIYSLIINIPKNKFSFVLFKGICDWNSSDIYWAKAPVELIDETEIQLTKIVSQNISYTNWAGGEVQLEFDSKKERLKIRKLEINDAKILYLVGAPTGYVEPTIENKELFKEYAFADNDGDGIYKGSISIPSDAFDFCFAKGLNGDITTYIIPNETNVIDFDYYGKCSGATSFAQTPMYWHNDECIGDVDIEFEYNSSLNTISFVCESLNQEKYLYLIGTPSGWCPPISDYKEMLKKWRLANSEENTSLYKGEFEIDNSQQLIFRFYDALTGWDSGGSYGCEIDDNIFHYNVDENGVYQGIIKNGKGSWGFEQWPTNKLYVEVDLYNMSVVFASSVTSIETIKENKLKLTKGLNNQFYIESIGNNVNYCVYNMHGTLVKTGNENIIDLRDFQLGMYIIKVTDGLNNIVDKVMIKN